MKVKDKLLQEFPDINKGGIHNYISSGELLLSDEDGYYA